ncbi:hypothetical protein GCM10018793_22380 [Streptomyces sulfonofaciens]|uniref:RDD family protein n=1 Tax=Streptomyces sulfonofaciens TaxID=68272 RepID=A0A919G2Y8_9ACTN|nr:RDD family protein [Streptomyces sulfonofaciens]GHH76516.1 hypothetical protein GCM10018793_22380 [Streptomyces sulfonofaciens]
MSAPTPAPGDDRPREGYYPDPSIPGYVRYWNGAAWVPGTSRPAPAAGETLPLPPGAAPASASVEETGPVFFDEEPPSGIPQQTQGAPEHPAIPEQQGAADHPESAAGAGLAQQPGAVDQGGTAAAQHPGIPEQTGPDVQDREEGAAARGAAPGAGPAAGSGEPADGPGEQGTSGRQVEHGSRPEPASAWQADASRQSGFGGDKDRRVSWGAPAGADPRVDPRAPHTPGPAQGEQGGGRRDGTMQIRAARQDAAAVGPAGGEQAQGGGNPEGTVVFRRPDAGRGPSAPEQGTPQGGPVETGTVAIRAVRPGAGPDTADPAGAPGQQTPPGPGGRAPGRFGAPQGPQTAGTSGPTVAGVPAAPGTVPYLPQQPGAGPAEPWPQAPGAGHPAPQQAGPAPAGGDQPVVPWKPPTSDPFLAAAQAQAAIRPAALGKRFAARLIDTVVLGAVTAVAAVPLGSRAADHIHDKIDAAKLSGETVTVWLLDGTTATSLGIVLAVLLVFGALYEAVPTARWGRTLGKKLCGLTVRHIEGHEPPSFGAALRRWLLYSVSGLLVVGVVGVLWCVFDRPWRQCWHDKAARTFVSA